MWWLELAAELASNRPTGERHPASIVDPSAHLDEQDGPIDIGKGSRICPGAYLKGPITIGEDCLIGNGTMLRGPILIGDEVRIGFASEIKNAVLRDGVTIGPQCFVADSLVEPSAYLGAQVRLSNHRLDKRNVTVMVAGQACDSGFDKLGSHIGAGAALGIQVIVLPGRSVAADSLVGPRVTVEKNLPTGRYRAAQDLQQF
jgi:UDP-N-acetylglucosamine diphosphorylase / glucose-1-phosphate thymidylyltransferase / UDP-N-acetylgalactosamine diphosphorylase / glucosamine-1-phosphate N-acetyltransferase / galactosamine-1-phosphate N-acetyltransferase